MRLISASALMDMLESREEHAILDLRREGDFAKEHLFFATNVPRSVLELRIEALAPRSDTPIVITETGPDGAQFERVFADFGYSDISLLEGGQDAWVRAGGQLYSGVNVPSKAFGEFIEEAAGTPHLSPEELREQLGRNPDLLLIDARPFSEYQAMSIEPALNCPGAELAYRIPHGVTPDRMIVVNCAGRTRSIIGAQTLIDAGLPNPVYALRDGTMGWRLAGFPLEQMARRRAPAPDAAALDAARERAHRRAQRAGVRLIESADCDRMLAEHGRTTYLFDVRDPQDYAGGHRDGATSAPGGQLVQTFDGFAAVRNARFILCDTDGVRAPMTAAWLRQMGHRDVFAVRDENACSQTPPPSPVADSLLRKARLIDPSRLRDLMREGAKLFDLASSKDYRRGHIEGALFAERHSLPENVSPTDRIVLTSPDGRLAALVAQELEARGIDACALEGGARGWASAGLPLQSGKGNLPQTPTDVFYRPYDLDEAAEESMRAYLDWEKGLMASVSREPGMAFVRL